MADLLTNRIRLQYFDLAGAVADKTFSFLGGQQIKVKETCWASAVTPILVAVDKSAIQCMVMVATGALTIYTNADTPGQDDTIVLAANIPLIWSGSPAIGGTNPFNTADVTELFVHNATGSQVVLEMVVLVDTTPIAS